METEDAVERGLSVLCLAPGMQKVLFKGWRVEWMKGTGRPCGIKSVELGVQKKKGCNLKCWYFWPLCLFLKPETRALMTEPASLPGPVSLMTPEFV